MLLTTCCRPGGAAKGGRGASIAAARGGHALRGRLDVGSTLRFAEGVGWISHRGPGCLSIAGRTADAGLARPSYVESALAPTCRASSAITRRLGLCRGGGGGSLLRRPVSLVPQAAVTAESPAELYTAEHNGPGAYAHRVPTNPLPFLCRHGC